MNQIIEDVITNLGESYCLHSYDYYFNITTHQNPAKTLTIQITTFLNICDREYNNIYNDELIMDITNSLQTDFINIANNSKVHRST